MKQSAKNRIIIWSIVSGLLVFILVAGFVINAGGRYVPSINQRIYGITHDSDPAITTNGLVYKKDELLDLQVNLVNGKIIFKKSDSDYIEINQFGSASSDETQELYYRFFEDDRSLEIFGSDEDFLLEGEDYSSDNLLFNFGDIFRTSTSKTIVVKIPKRSAFIPYITVNTASAQIEIDNIDTDNLSVNSFSGGLTANDLNTENISIETVSGDIKMSNTSANEIQVNSVSGKININGNAEYIMLDSVSGDLDFSTNSTDTCSISVNTVSGSANIFLPENCGFKVNNSSVSGGVKSSFNGRNIDDCYVYGDGYTEIDFDSVSGSISLNQNKTEQNEKEKAEQKKDSENTVSTTQTATEPQTQPTTAKETKGNY